jgi:hypothetical protein
MFIFHFLSTLDAATIAKELDFNLTCIQPKHAKSSRGPIRMATKTWAITAWTTVSSKLDHNPQDKYLYFQQIFVVVVVVLFRRNSHGRD